MSDLISRNYILNSRDVAKRTKVINGTAYVDVEFLVEFIENVPTAYDIDGVVEQLGKLIPPDKCGENTPEQMAYSEGIVDAIEIVKGGGVVEWQNQRH